MISRNAAPARADNSPTAKTVNVNVRAGVSGWRSSAVTVTSTEPAGALINNVARLSLSPPRANVKLLPALSCV